MMVNGFLKLSNRLPPRQVTWWKALQLGSLHGLFLRRERYHSGKSPTSTDTQRRSMACGRSAVQQRLSIGDVRSRRTTSATMEVCDDISARRGMLIRWQFAACADFQEGRKIFTRQARPRCPLAALPGACVSRPEAVPL